MSDDEDTELPEGWFKIDGIQEGKWTLKNRLTGLGVLANQQADILDVGCAEGLIGEWLMNRGNATLHGLERHGPFIERARSLMRNYPETRVRFFQVDLNYIQAWLDLNPNALRPHYGIVLCLLVLHKVTHPEIVLKLLADRVARYLALHLPNPVINDPRSSNQPFDTKAWLLDNGFRVIADDTAGDFSRLIYQRNK